MQVPKVPVVLTDKGKKETSLDPNAVYHVTDDPSSFESGHFKRATAAEVPAAKKATKK